MTENTAAIPADAVAARLVDRAPPKWQPYLRLMRLDRPIGTWLLYWPCVFGLALGAAAESRPFGTLKDIALVALMGIGSVVMRGAGCAFNDIVDRDFDASVARTRGRPIPSGAVSVKQAIVFTIALCLIGLVILLLLRNWTAIILGASSLLLVAAYPFMKRITWWPQAWLGLTFNWGAIVGFAAETGTIDSAALMLYAGLICWTLGYDTIYAHQDKDDDALIGVKSTARLFAERSKDWIFGFYIAAFTLVLAAGFTEHIGSIYVILMLIAGGHLMWQVRQLDIDDSAKCLKLFRANRDTGALIAAALILSTWIG
ncbi:4-hydroxybenzoate polyprenyltransferase [Rhizomicrobium palustre]|uniref:4-hydroxybenzoate octaprenyltransferase n=1 Tax=Rhizomicrobium palustre TaxID=189966 RepID=A0A846N1I8_9PROT|nr:4-hydroxybenzoate octaprenyltransferase [Rhizomicrobium palustre]NIK89335.1 4-hydroxybenzoate polyprenyltransferase [Rhizomicrobium palustre]